MGYHGLGPWEPIVLLLEEPEQWHNNGDMADFLDAAKCTLWAVNKELAPQKTFASYFGKNEKTKVVCKLQSKGSGAPVRSLRSTRRLTNRCLHTITKSRRR